MANAWARGTHFQQSEVVEQKESLFWTYCVKWRQYGALIKMICKIEIVMEILLGTAARIKSALQIINILNDSFFSI